LFDLLLDPVPANIYYNKIFTERFSLNKLIRICEIATFVNTKINGLTNRTYHKDANFHFMAAIYHLENKNWTDDYKFTRINAAIRRVIEIMRTRTDPDKSFNYFFSKTTTTWTELKNIIDLY
jgi:hypothetical protein